MTAPASIARFVRTVAWRSRGAYAVESLALGAAAGGLTAAAAVLSGADGAAAPALGACAISALACAATWAVEHHRTAADYARRADERLGEDGALATAFECEARGAAGPVERALVGRVASRLAPGCARRAAHAVSLALLAAPLAAAGVVAAAVELASERGGAAVAPGVERRAPGASAHTPPESDAPSDPSSASEPGSAASDDSGAGGRETAGGRDASRDPRAKRTETAGAAGGEERSAGGDSGAGAGTGSEARGADTGASGAGDGSGLARDGAEPTMSGSADPTETSMIPAPTDPPRAAPGHAGDTLAEAGTLAGRWWPARHDEVVRAWIASRAR